MRLPDYEPMLAAKRPEPFDDEGWWFEVKWDGYRAVVGASDGIVRARSRRGIDLLGPFPEIGTVEIPDGVVVDGEIVAFDEEGRPSFSLLQGRTGFGGTGTGAKVGVNLVVFDVLFHGAEVIDLPYEERRALLERLELPPPMVVPEPTPASGISLFGAVEAKGIEGIVAKRLDSPYEPGRRASGWLKVKNVCEQDVVIGGWTPGEGGRGGRLGALAVGVMEDGELAYAGKDGTGFTEKTLALVQRALEPLRRADSPFEGRQPPKGTIFVEPRLVARVELREWTRSGTMRAPSFKGLRDDKDPQECVREAG